MHIRDGKAISSTNEDMASVVSDDKVGVFTNLAEISDDTKQIFLLKPDMAALKKAGLLK